MHVANLYRYPIKGLSPERLDEVQIISNEGFPIDRQYALLFTEAYFDSSAPIWLAKANFIMLMLHEQIAQLKTHYDEVNKTLEVKHPDGSLLNFKLDNIAGRSALENFFYEFMPQHLSHKPRLLQATGHHFSDKAPKYVSLINLASLRELEQEWNEDLDPLRFRANVYIDAAKPFSELEWVGKTIQLGQITAMVMQRNGRCSATNVDPKTGIRDRNIPGKLRKAFGHKDLGIYLSVTQGGLLRVGDAVAINSSIDIATQASTSPFPFMETGAAELLICTACYYLFDPQLLDASWHTPDDLPESWRCRDCGATRESLRNTKEN